MTSRLGPIWLRYLLLLLLTVEAHGEVSDAKRQPQRGDTVATRQRPELQQLGIPAGGFRVYPKLGYTVQHNDNIFAVENNRQSDQISIYSPGVALASNWTRHDVELSANADLGRYRDFSSEDYDDWQVSINALLDVSRSTRIRFGALHANLHEARGSSDDARGLQPTTFSTTQEFVGLKFQPGRFSLSPTLDFNSFDYDDVQALRFDSIEQDDRDRKEYTLSLRGAYEVGRRPDVFVRSRRIARDYDMLQAFTRFDHSSQGYEARVGTMFEVFVLARHIVRDYDMLQASTGFDRSSDGDEAGVGMMFELSGITRAQFFVGYRKQRYEQPLPDISTPIFDLSLIWNASNLTTLELSVLRSLRETNASFYSGYVSTLASIKLDHELRRNLFLQAEFGQIVDNYEGTTSTTPEDKRVKTSAGASWVLNRNVDISFRHEYTNRNLTDAIIAPGLPDVDFKTNVSWFRIEFRQ